ncbi:MAG: SCO family protein [Solirubrobacterales bacterium]|nr:SCO family protein [Solirubrobacterales bacterium]
MLAAVLGLGVGFAVHSLTAGTAASPAIVSTHFGMHGEATWAAGAHPAPPIETLPDQTGHLFSLASLRGRSVAIVFFDSHCTQECPLEGRELASAEQSLPAAQRPVLVAVSVNPLDTPASAAHAAKAWGLASVGPWHWLMGTRRQLAPVWAAYHVYVSPHPVNGDIQHTEVVYLIDRRGDMRSGYLYPFLPGFVTSDLRTLAGSKRA